MTLRVRWEGDFFVWSSLALINRELVQRLAERPGFSVGLHTRGAVVDPRQVPEMTPLLPYLQPLDGPADVHVRHQWPFKLDPPPEGRWVVIQHWEFGSIPRDWVRPMREQIDEIWVASQFVCDSFVGSGVPRDRVVVIPPGVDTTLFTDEGPTYPIATDKGFKFLFVGGTIPRKGIDLLLRAYGMAFRRSDDVTLVIKDFGGKSFYVGQGVAEQVAALEADGAGPEIRLIEDDLTPQDLAALYRSVDCLVQPYRGEGFGLPIAEAMASALPVIVPAYGACLDFCDAETAYLIPAQIVPHAERMIGDAETVHHPWWCEVDVPTLALAMRRLVADPTRGRERGRRGQAVIRSRFTWELMAERVSARLQALVQAPARRLAQELAPFQVEGRRRLALAFLPDWTDPQAPWQAGLAAYVAAFGAADDVSLILYVPPDPSLDLGAVEAALLAAIAAAGHDPEQVADLIVLQEALRRPDHADLLVATDGYLPAGEAAETAHRAAANLYGRPILTPTVAALRAWAKAGGLTEAPLGDATTAPLSG